MEKNFQILRNVIAPEKVEAVHHFLQNQAEERLKDIENIKNDQSKGSLAEIDFSILDDGQRKTLTGHFPAEVRLDKVILELATSEEIAEAVHSFTEWQDLNLHLPPMARFVSPENKNAKVPIHQDVVYNQHMSDFITVWIPLVPVNSECGGVKCAHDPGVQVEEVDLQSNHIWFEGMDAKDIQFEDCVPMMPGDILIFSKTTIHGSMENNSNYTRYSLDLRYFPSSVTSSKHYINLKTGVVHEPR